MLPAKWLPAHAWRAAVPRIAAILMATTAALQAEPASAMRYGGPVEAPGQAPGSASSEAGTELQLFRTRAVAIPTNRFADNWIKLVNAVAETDLATVCNEPTTECSAGAIRWLSYLSQIRNLPRREQLVLVNRYV